MTPLQKTGVNYIVPVPSLSVFENTLYFENSLESELQKMWNKYLLYIIPYPRMLMTTLRLGCRRCSVRTRLDALYLRSLPLRPSEASAAMTSFAAPSLKSTAPGQMGHVIPTSGCPWPLWHCSFSWHSCRLKAGCMKVVLTVAVLILTEHSHFKARAVFCLYWLIHYMKTKIITDIT